MKHVLETLRNLFSYVKDYGLNLQSALTTINHDHPELRGVYATVDDKEEFLEVTKQVYQTIRDRLENKLKLEMIRIEHELNEIVEFGDLTE